MTVEDYHAALDGLNTALMNSDATAIRVAFEKVKQMYADLVRTDDVTADVQDSYVEAGQLVHDTLSILGVQQDQLPTVTITAQAPASSWGPLWLAIGGTIAIGYLLK